MSKTKSNSGFVEIQLLSVPQRINGKHHQRSIAAKKLTRLQELMLNNPRINFEAAYAKAVQNYQQFFEKDLRDYVTVTDDSMSPTFAAGSHLRIKILSTKFIVPGEVYGVELTETPGRIFIRRFYYHNDDQTNGLVDCLADNIRSIDGPAGKIFEYPLFTIPCGLIQTLYKITHVANPTHYL